MEWSVLIRGKDDELVLTEVFGYGDKLSDVIQTVRILVESGRSGTIHVGYQGPARAVHIAKEGHTQ